MSLESSVYNHQSMLVLYDGECVLCNFWIYLIKRNQQSNIIKCQSLQAWMKNKSQESLTEPQTPITHNSEIPLEQLSSTEKCREPLDLPTRFLAISNLPDSVIVIHNNQILIESDAVLAIVKQLHGPIRLLLIGRALPKGLRNLIYRWVAKNRYRWFGKTDYCSL